LLQALHRLEERDLLRAEWGETENGRQARYYSMTAAGRAHLRTESAALVEQFDALKAVLAVRSASR